MTHEFDVELFEQRLTNLKDTQEGIQQMSSWCLQQRTHHKKIVSSWLNVLKQVRVEHRLTLFYLANDVIQYSKRKNYEFVESWGTTLQKATTMVRDEKVRNKIFRIFKIWEQRDIYPEDFISDLNGLLNVNPIKKTQQLSNAESSDEFQNSVLVTNIRDCVRLHTHSSKYLRHLPPAPNCDVESIKYSLKDRSHSEDVVKEINHYVKSLETYVRSLKSEITARKSLVANIETAETFYRNQKGEVKVVVTAYKNFGNRIKLMKKKLDEITPNLPSPIPSPDINAPSPEPDADIVLPDEQNSLNSFLNDTQNGYSSYMDGKLPFDINDFNRRSPDPLNQSTTDGNTRPIEVISSRKEEKISGFDVNDFFKSITSESQYSSTGMPLPVPPVSNYPVSDNTPNMFSTSSISSYGSQNDSYDSMSAAYSTNSTFLSTPSSTYNRNVPLMPPPPIPPALESSEEDFNTSYQPPGLESSEEDFNSTWEMDMTWTPMDNTSSFSHVLDTPVSPPHFEREGINSNVVEYVERRSDDLLRAIQDVDHRQLHLPPTDSMPQSHVKEKGRAVDIDHRNLISLTGSPGPNKDTSAKGKVSPIWPADDKDFRPSTLSSVVTSNQDTDYRTPTIQPVPTTSSNENTSSSTTMLKPPPLPPQICDFLSSSNSTFSKSMPPPNFATSDMNTQIKQSHPAASSLGKIGVKGNNANDNNESIDMEMSDEDLEEFKREIDELSLPSESADSNHSGYESTASQEYTTSTETSATPTVTTSSSTYRQPLLQTPEFTSQWETIGNNGTNNNNGSNERMWKTPRGGLSIPPFRMNNPVQFPQRPANPFAGPMPPQHRNFSPQMKGNFRGALRPPMRGSPMFFNNRGRGGLGMRGPPNRPPRGNFRGPMWQ